MSARARSPFLATSSTLRRSTVHRNLSRYSGGWQVAGFPALQPPRAGIRHIFQTAHGTAWGRRATLMNSSPRLDRPALTTAGLTTAGLIAAALTAGPLFCIRGGVPGVGGPL